MIKAARKKALRRHTAAAGHARALVMVIDGRVALRAYGVGMLQRRNAILPGGGADGPRAGAMAHRLPRTQKGGGKQNQPRQQTPLLRHGCPQRTQANLGG